MNFPLTSARTLSVAACAAVFSIGFCVRAQAQDVSARIMGEPPPLAQSGELYAFQPWGGIHNGTTPYFEIENAPSWAIFQSADGWFGGTPAAGDVGVYTGIRISITDGNVRAYLPEFSITVHPQKPSGSALLTWQPPVHNVDGSALANLDGYQVYVGRGPQLLYPYESLPDPHATRYRIQGLNPGVYYFAITSVNTDGVESERSELIPVAVD